MNILSSGIGPCMPATTVVLAITITTAEVSIVEAAVPLPTATKISVGRPSKGEATYLAI
jgi:hypothetical protein